MFVSLIIALLGTGCIFISDDEYAQRLHQTGVGTDETPCVETTWWVDEDGDGYGDPDGPTESCEQPDGTADNGDDCDDSDPIRTPDTVWYVDADGDGFGGESTQVTGCDAPSGSVANGDDCNDANSEVHPDALEDCATPVDDNCALGTNDPDAVGCIELYADGDADGFAGEDSMCLCEAEEPYTGTVSKDCDDTDPAVHPDAEEICGNGVDDDCDGTPSGCGVASKQSLHDSDVVIEGAVAEARFGTTIAGGGDLTGDGIPDAVIAGYHWNDSTGRVCLVPGPLTEDLSTSALRAWDGSAVGQKLGMSMSIVGDTDGDGIADLLIGSPQAQGGASWSGGEAYLLQGPLDASGTGTLLEDAAAIIQGGANGTYAGRHVSGVGDFNGDDLADVVVSLHGQNSAALLLGPIAGTLSAQESDDVDLVLAGLSGTETGIDTSGVGDVDGDGLGDVLIAARSGGPSGEGKVYLVLGHEAPGSDLDLADGADLVLTGAAPGDATGEKLGSGDVDGDGRSDLLIAAPAADGGSINAGVVYVVVDPGSGTLDLGTDAWLTLSGLRAYGRLGEGLDHIAGADGGDGSFLVVGAAQAETGADDTAGEVFIFDASAGGSLETDSAIGHLLGTIGYGQAGAAVKGVGDMDGDGIVDLMVGEPVRDTAVTRGGSVYFLAGGGM